MLIYPDINPIAFHVGSLEVHWYGIMYLIGFASAWGLALYRSKGINSNWNSQQISDFIFYCAIGVIVGGRLGYMIFYDLPNLLANPLLVFRVWDGGMSFHGGLLGVVIALWLFCRKHQKTFFDAADFAAPLVPIGLAAGRIGNFINGELWGRVTTMPWGMLYPNAGPLPRHPSELYEFLLEGVLLFIILWVYSSKRRPPMAVSAMFLIFYGTFRFIAEFFRQPDSQLGFIAFGWLTMGQLLCVPMVIFGIILIILAYRQKSALNHV